MEKYLPISEVAKHFNVTRTGVRYWIEKYQIPHKLVKQPGVKRRVVLDVGALKIALGSEGD